MLNTLIAATNSLKFNLTWPTITFGEWATAILILSLGLLSALELRAPKEKWSAKSLRQSYKTNFSLFVFNSLIMSLLSAVSLPLLAKHNYGHGLLANIADPASKAVLAFLALDLLLYVWHRASHSFDYLWMFHRVHHNDPSLNVSTGFRVHVVELFIIHVLKAVLIIVMGMNQMMVLTNELVMTLFIMFHHTNISFKGEKWLGLMVIVPYLHRTHHSKERTEHDSNYGAVLSVWDHLFGTLSELEPAEIGIKGSSPMDFVNLLKFGFTLQTPPIQQPINLKLMIAEAAYYKAEKRNFQSGYELDDWLEVEKEILSMMYAERKVQEKPRNKIQFNYLNWLHFPMRLDFRH